MATRSRVKYLVVMVLFIAVALAAFTCRVERHARAATMDLAAAIPAAVGDWRMSVQDTSLGSKEARFLNETLFRTYRRQDGKTIMLVVAYGADQRKKFNIHMPETCYRASGYEVESLGRCSMDSPYLRLRRLLVKDGPSTIEPVQYWIILNGKPVTNEFEKRAKHFYYSLLGAEADGVLVRVSSHSASRNPDKEYEVQKEFISSLYQSVKPELRRVLFGNGV
ncbi:MAG: EpsI family protein [Desulfuromonadales bacterium]|nr:MAG: EpsI family protein [Desulfuromonadales bacterium]